MLVKLNRNFLLFNSIWNSLKEIKYLVISTLFHIFIVLLFLCPYFHFRKNTNFISNSNQISVQILVQENKSKIKKENNLGFLQKNKNQDKKEASNKTHQDNQEVIISSQYVDNIKYNILKAKNPNYPTIVKKIHLIQKVIIKTRLLIDKTGNIVKIEFLGANIDKTLENFFQKEILESLKSWKFSTVTINNTPVSIYFYKDFIFVD